MKEQTPLSVADMRAAFEKARAERREAFDKNGTAEMLRNLSETLQALQATGVNIASTVYSGDHTNAYDLMYTVSGSGGGAIEAYGFVRTGKTRHMWAVASEHAGNTVARLYLSKHNIIEGEGGRSTRDGGQTNSRVHIPGYCYDFNEDEGALQKLQQQLITICANNEAVLENDPGNVFNKEAYSAIIQKPARKLRL